MFDEVLAKLVPQLIYWAVLVLVAVIAWFVRRLVALGIEYLKGKIGEENFNRIAGYAEIVVRFLEQSPIFRDLEGAKKKEMAILDILEYCKQHNIPIDRELIDRAIEASVHIIKGEKLPELEAFTSTLSTTE